MPDLSEFITFVAEKSGIQKPSLIEKDLMIHRILKDIYGSRHFAENYLFKGGSCLVKCYFGYYRFSVDLDFTWQDQKVWVGLGKYELRRRLLEEISNFGSLLEKTAQDTGLKFKNELKSKRYFEFGGRSRMVTFKLWKNSELIKIQGNFVDEILFPQRIVTVRTLLDDVQLSKDDKAYFEEFLEFYKPFSVKAYDKKEILCEKVRAILTRRTQKLRDFYDLFTLEKSGCSIEALKEQTIVKIKACLQFKRYRANLERNRGTLDSSAVLENPFERELFVAKPPKDFDVFLKRLPDALKDIMNRV
jgi:predicted nucleotidyltransferase component of viral defense system